MKKHQEKQVADLKDQYEEFMTSVTELQEKVCVSVVFCAMCCVPLTKRYEKVKVYSLLLVNYRRIFTGF